MADLRKIVVMGLGYVGLPLAILLSQRHNVIGVDVDREHVSALNEGRLFIPEEDLQELFGTPQVRSNFRAQATPEAADVFVIAVPTPLAGGNVADLSYVRSAADSICPYLERGNLVILESTVPPLTSRSVLKPMIENHTRWNVPKDVLLAHCPERVLSGNIVHELIHTDRVCGGIDAASAKAASELYRTFVKAEIFITEDVTAELCKLAENAYRDVNVAFANELALVAEGLGVDGRRLVALANRHPRVTIHSPGIGVGGHCLPIDPWFIYQTNPDRSQLIKAAQWINDSIPGVIAGKIKGGVEDIEDPKIIVIGLTYKPNVADTRESPALAICDILRDHGCRIESYDPLVEGREYMSLAEVSKGADCLAILVEHDHVIRELEATEAAVLGAMRTPKIVRF